MSNLMVRVLTALIGVPLVLFAMFHRDPLPGGGFLFFLLPLLITVAGASELNSLLAGGSASRPRRLLYLLLALAAVCGSFGSIDTALPHRGNWTGLITPAEWLVLMLLTALLAVGALRVGSGTIPGSVGDAGQALLAVAGLALPASFLALLWRLRQGAWCVLLLFLCTWMADTGGYFAGRFLGRTKLAPAISPKKTIAGFWGGMCASVLAAVLLAQFAGGRVPVTVGQALLFGVLMALGGTLGDLIESLVKREMQCKDSGGLIPGHGGVLDRFDAILFNAPLAYLYLLTL